METMAMQPQVVNNGNGGEDLDVKARGKSPLLDMAKNHLADEDVGSVARSNPSEDLQATPSFDPDVIDFEPPNPPAAPLVDEDTVQSDIMQLRDKMNPSSMIDPLHPPAAQDDPLQSVEEQDELNVGDSHCLTEGPPPASEESPESGNKRSMFKKQSIRRLDMDTGFSYYENTVTGETDWVSDDSGSASASD